MAHTTFLSRLLGLFAIIVAVSIATHKADTMATVTLLVQDPPVLLVLGFIGIAAGLAMVLTHNIWKGGPQPVVVTLCGWVILLRGVVLLALPQSYLRALLYVSDYRQLFYWYAGFAFVMGAYLTVAGFRRT